jgi:nucleotide-binding universal stress UspA family protein
MISSLRQILVHLDPTSATPARLATARQVAQQHGAELASLYACTPALVELPYAPLVEPVFVASLAEIEEERRRRVLKAFDKEMMQPGPVASWAHTVEVPVAGAVAQQAFYADLLVLGQRNPADEAARSLPPDFVENVLLASGRPALLLPYVGWSRAVGDTVAIAWKETPEAARAVRAAMPFLQRADRVHVLTWGEEGSPRVAGEALDLERYLRVHGVQVTWHHEGGEPSGLGELLLSRLFDLDADLLVMGCYGHGRAREWILGGVSRSILDSMTLPVLMAH